ncbi:putative remorin [Arabidopsis thaliana]
MLYLKFLVYTYYHIGDEQSKVIKAWKELKITKVNNKTQKKLLDISGWEKKKTTKIESELARIQVIPQKTSTNS